MYVVTQKMDGYQLTIISVETSLWLSWKLFPGSEMGLSYPDLYKLSEISHQCHLERHLLPHSFNLFGFLIERDGEVGGKFMPCEEFFLLNTGILCHDKSN